MIRCSRETQLWPARLLSGIWPPACVSARRKNATRLRPWRRMKPGSRDG